MAKQIKKENEIKEENEKEIKENETMANEDNFTSSMRKENEEIENLTKSNAEKDKQINDLNNQLSELTKNFQLMQSQFQMMMSGGFANNNSAKEDDRDVLVGCRALNGSALSSGDGSLVIRFSCDEEKYISVGDLKMIFKENSLRNNKRHFEKDTFYFVDAKDYDYFKIKKRIDLSHENIRRILELDSVSMIDEVNKMTDNLNDFETKYNLKFEICKMMINENETLRNWRYENRIALENYLGNKFDDLLAAVGAVELLGRTKFRK